MLYFKIFVRFVPFKTLLCVGRTNFLHIPSPPLLIPKRNFRASNGGLSHDSRVMQLYAVMMQRGREICYTVYLNVKLQSVTF